MSATPTTALVVKPDTQEEVAGFLSDAAHLDGPIAAALMQNAERLLAAPPEILPADVLAAKVP